jgi:hypothetical protein
VSQDPRASGVAAARIVTLYVLSFLAISSAQLAWRPRVAGLVASAVLTGLAVFLGGVLAEALSGVASAGVRRRARLLAVLFVPVASLLAAIVPWGVPVLGVQVAIGLALLQLVILLVAQTLGLEGLVLWGAFSLTLTAAAGGALVGGVAFVSLLALSGVFFAVDQVDTKLVRWPGAPAPPLARVLTDAFRLFAPPVVLLGIALPLLGMLPWVTSPDTSTAAGGGVVSTPEVQQAYRWLIVLALVGAASLVLAFRLLKGRGKDARPLIEMEETHVEAEEVLEAPERDDPRYAAARGRVIRAYVRFLTRARRGGLRLEPFLTPREIEGRVRRPEEPLEVLTGLFMDARYGPDEPGDESAHRAEAASRTVIESLRRRRRPGRATRHPSG